MAGGVCGRPVVAFAAFPAAAFATAALSAAAFAAAAFPATARSKHRD